VLFRADPFVTDGHRAGNVSTLALRQPAGGRPHGVPDTGIVKPNLATWIAERALDADLAALVWLLVEGGVPVVVAGSASQADRAALASALLSVDPRRPAVILDADADPPTIAGLAALLQGGSGVALVSAAADLAAVLEHLHAAPAELPYDAIRRLGVVVVLDRSPDGPRVTAAHYLRPTERDGQGHVQRRAPAVLVAWDEATKAWEHYAWAMTPELADRVDRSHADLEQRQLDRAGFLAAMVRSGPLSQDDWAAVVGRYLATEATRTPARAPQLLD